MTALGDLKPGLRHSATLRVTEQLAVPAQGRALGFPQEMPPVFATANMIALVEWTCVAALAPYLAPNQRTVGTRVEMSHTAATPIGMQVTAEIELIKSTAADCASRPVAMTRRSRSVTASTSAPSSTATAS